MDYERGNSLPEKDDSSREEFAAASADTLISKENVSTKVQALATEIYQELEKLIGIYGNKFLQNLMPLVVSALESLDAVHSENQDLTLKLALLKQDQKHLLSEYEREKTSRKTAESKILRLEDEYEEEKKTNRINQAELEANSRVLNQKVKSLSEQLVRFEERDCELTRDYQCLHDRYTELMRSYVEYAERVRNKANISRMVPHSVATDTFVPTRPDPINLNYLATHPASVNSPCPCPPQRPMDPCVLYVDATERQRIMRSILETTPELHDSGGFSDQNLTEPCFDELSQGDLLSEDGHDVKSFDGSSCTPQQNLGDSASLSMFSGVTREVNNLIKENQDLVQTKNALNVVTNDLIGRIDELTCENVRLSSERNALVTNSTGMWARIKDLEQECRRLRQELENSELRDSVYAHSQRSADSSDEDFGESLSSRKRFSRMEMSRVLLERNYYKEQLLELQDTVRWTEMLRVEQRNRVETLRVRKRGRIWDLFSKLFTPSKRRDNDGPQSNEQATPSVTPSNMTMGVGRISPSLLNKKSAFTRSNVPRWSESRIFSDNGTTPTMRNRFSLELESTGKHHIQSNDWLAARQLDNTNCGEYRKESYAPPLSLCYIRPVCENLAGFKVSYATGVFADRARCSFNGTLPITQVLNRSKVMKRIGGQPTSDSTVVAHSLIRQNNSDHINSTSSATQLADRISGSSELETSFNHSTSNLVWVCSLPTVPPYSEQTISEDRSHPKIHSLLTIVDANEPNQNVDSFGITVSTVLCMAAIPGTDPDTQTHLQHISQHWYAVPLDLSEELLSMGRRMAASHHPHDSLVHSTIPNCPVLSQSVCWSTSSYSISTSHKHPSLMVGNGSDRNIASSSSTSHAGDSQHVDPMLSYSVERRRFTVRTLPTDYCDSAPLKTSASFFEHQLSPAHPDGSNAVHELPSSTVASVPDPSLPYPNAPTSAQPTMWIGCYNGDVFIHSTVTQWRRSMHAIHLPDAVTQICHFKGYAFVSLANGQIVVFRRRLQSPHPSLLSSSLQSGRALVSSSNLPDEGLQSTGSPTASMSRVQMSNSTYSANAFDWCTGTWDFTEACVITCGHVRSTNRRMTVVPCCACVWIASRNRIMIIDAITLQAVNSFEIPSTRGAQIHIMESCGEAVWIGQRPDAVLYSYHASTQQLLQTVEFGSVLLKQFPNFKWNKSSNTRGSKSSHLSITAMLPSDEHLWIGTSNGLVASIPWDRREEDSLTNESELTGTISSGHVAMGAVLLSELQVSRHKHDGAVHFFTTVDGSGPDLDKLDHMTKDCSSVAEQSVNGTSSPIRKANSWSPLPLPPNTQSQKKLVISGGRGYTFLEDRLGSKSESSENKSYLIVWEAAVQ